jgi:hypothetical protein
MAHIVHTIDVSQSELYGFHNPSTIATDGNHVWVGNYNSPNVIQISVADPSHATLLSDGYGFTGIYSIVTKGPYVWTANYLGNSVTRFNANDGSNPLVLYDPSYGFNYPRGIATDGSFVWVTNRFGYSVTQFNASDGSNIEILSDSTYGFNYPTGITTDGSFVWVINNNNSTVTRFNASDGSNPNILSDSTYGFNRPSGIATDGTYVWVGNYSGNSVTRFNASDGSNPIILSNTVINGFVPTSVYSDGTYLWMTNSEHNQINRLNLSTNVVTDFSYTSLNYPNNIHSDGSYVWVTNLGDSFTSIVNASTGDYIGSFDVGYVYTLNGITHDPSFLFIIGYSCGANTIFQYTLGGSYVQSIYISGNGNPLGIATDASNVWVTNGLIEQFNIQDPYGYRTVIPDANQPFGIAIDSSYVWVANVNDSTINQFLSAPPFSLVNTYSLPSNCFGVCTDGTHVWANTLTGLYQLVNGSFQLFETMNFSSEVNLLTTDGTFVCAAGSEKVIKIQQFSGPDQVTTNPVGPSINQPFSVSLYTPTINVIPGYPNHYVIPHQYELHEGNTVLSTTYTYDPTTHIMTFDNVTFTTQGTHTLAWVDVTAQQTLYTFTLNNACFKEGTKILTDRGYRLIQDLRKGDLVKTYKHGFQPINSIGKSVIYHPASQDRIKDQLYRCTHPEVFEDLVITGCHSILVPYLKDKAQWKKTEELMDKVYQTDGLFRLPACLDEDHCVVYENPGSYTIYHFALEHPNYYCNYGVYANGLLVETCSQRYLKELSGMELIE